MHRRPFEEISLLPHIDKCLTTDEMILYTIRLAFPGTTRGMGDGEGQARQGSHHPAENR